MEVEGSESQTLAGVIPAATTAAYPAEDFQADRRRPPSAVPCLVVVRIRWPMLTRGAAFKSFTAPQLGPLLAWPGGAKVHPVFWECC